MKTANIVKVVQRIVQTAWITSSKYIEQTPSERFRCDWAVDPRYGCTYLLTRVTLWRVSFVLVWWNEANVVLDTIKFWLLSSCSTRSKSCVRALKQCAIAKQAICHSDEWNNAKTIVKAQQQILQTIREQIISRKTIPRDSALQWLWWTPTIQNRFNARSKSRAR